MRTFPHFSWSWQVLNDQALLQYDVLGPAEEEEAVGFYDAMLTMVPGDIFLFIGNYGRQETSVSSSAMEGLVDRTLQRNITRVRCCIVTRQRSYAAKARLYEALCISRGLDGLMYSTRNQAAGRRWIEEQISGENSGISAD